MTSNNSRREFLKKLGLSVGATVALSTGASASTSINITADQKVFMDEYELWMDAFMEMMAEQQSGDYNLANTEKLMHLSDQAEGYKEQLAKYLKEEDFARYYLQRIDRMVEQIQD